MPAMDLIFSHERENERERDTWINLFRETEQLRDHHLICLRKNTWRMRRGCWYLQRWLRAYNKCLILFVIISGGSYESSMSLAPTFLCFVFWNFDNQPKTFWWKKRAIRPTWTRPKTSLVQKKWSKVLRLPSCFFGDHCFLKSQWTHMIL